jgi:hypothetical protein
MTYGVHGRTWCFCICLLSWDNIICEGESEELFADWMKRILKKTWENANLCMKEVA